MFPNLFREFRHSPCLMAPLTLVGLLLLCLFWVLAFAWKFPLFVLGFVMSPLVHRTSFIIEFLYPLSVGRWVHLTIVRLIGGGKGAPKNSDKNRGFHSRTVETRIEVIPGRLYIHPMSQLLDNLAYLVVCRPDSASVVDPSATSGKGNKKNSDGTAAGRIVAFLVDCGDAAATLKQLELISETHYQKQKIHLQAILSTHKHHDHTAGNIPLFRNHVTRESLKMIVGGAVEKVPGCNYPVGNGDMIDLPKYGDNDMANLIELEAIATPAHTRGSITYALRIRPEFVGPNSAYAFLFTGDTMFSAGGGVAFEADLDPDQEQNEAKNIFTNIIKASASIYAVERCFGEILARAIKSHALPRDVTDRVLIMPGHEYTHELLHRQMASGSLSENCRWKSFAPSVFFETASQLYVTLHRRSLPYSSGKLVTAMGSPVRTELQINPYFRSMQKRGELILQAVDSWHKHFARQKIPYHLSAFYYSHFAGGDVTFKSKYFLEKSTSSENQWNLDASDLARSVFTTVYTEDLESIIHDLSEGSISAKESAERLSDIQNRMKQSTVSRRPLPGSLPSDRAVYRGLLALALLGSSPSALTLSDSSRMNLPKPVNQSSDKIQVSKSHLISVLQWLGLLTPENRGPQVIAMIHQLWKEAREDSPNVYGDDTRLETNGNANHAYDTIDAESDSQDIVELGDLKWSLYGVPRQQTSFHYCIPCAGPQRMDNKHPVRSSGLKPQSGEIVRHDIYTCPVCRTRAGCVFRKADINKDENGSTTTWPAEPDPVVDECNTDGPVRPVMTSFGSAAVEDNEEDVMYVEVTSMLNEAN